MAGAQRTCMPSMSTFMTMKSVRTLMAANLQEKSRSVPDGSKEEKIPAKEILVGRWFASKMENRFLPGLFHGDTDVLSLDTPESTRKSRITSSGWKKSFSKAFTQLANPTALGNQLETGALLVIGILLTGLLQTSQNVETNVSSPKVPIVKVTS